MSGINDYCLTTVNKSRVKKEKQERNNSPVSEALKELRTRLGISQGKLSVLLEITTVSAFKYEGGHIPTTPILGRMISLALSNRATADLALSLCKPVAEQLGVTPEALFLAFMVSDAYPSGLPSPAEMKPILARAKALLGE